MKNKAGKSICGAIINGPKMGSNVVLWRKYCQRVVKREFDRCWQHG